MTAGGRSESQSDRAAPEHVRDGPARIMPWGAAASAGAETLRQFLEASGKALVGGVEVLPLRDEPHPVVAPQAEVGKDAFEGAAGMGVNNQQLVLVELNLDRPLRMEDRDPGAAVVEEEILEVPKDALEHRPLDPFAGDLDG